MEWILLALMLSAGFEPEWVQAAEQTAVCKEDFWDIAYRDDPCYDPVLEEISYRCYEEIVSKGSK